MGPVDIILILIAFIRKFHKLILFLYTLFLEQDNLLWYLNSQENVHIVKFCLAFPFNCSIMSVGILNKFGDR